MKKQPLAFTLRPKSIKDCIGQQHLIGPNCLLTKMVQTKQPINLIFYGYPGIGKTTLAAALCLDMNLPHQTFNAAIDKKEDLTKIIQLAKLSTTPYVVIVEEIHRLNKDKQDILLPYLENGTITMFACTTENPYFTVNPAIRSRCIIARLNLITPNELFLWLKNKINLGVLPKNITHDVIKEIAYYCNGDVRSALNAIDIINQFYLNEKIDHQTLQHVLLSPTILASGYGDEYYDMLSAFHKSIRGSDVDAGIYYLARLLTTGDLVSITRRMIACAYEDIGLANPSLCSRVVIAAQAADRLGIPECYQILADIVIEMCLSPKSNSGYLAIDSALKDVNSGKCYEIPKHIKDNNYASHEKLGNSGYIYPHNYPNHWVKQEYLPQQLKNKKYYIEANNENEHKINEYLKKIKNQK